MKYTYKLTEEFARWAFETRCNETEDWYIAFTNPTAGPWKVMKCLNEDKIENEIYRFGSNEERPDIVLINDKLNLIIIFEAKDLLHKLIEGNQAEKSVKVVSDITKFLRTCSSPNWGRKRQNYTICLGLLWGCEEFENMEKINTVLDTYSKIIQKYENVNHSIIVSIITKKTNQNLDCYLHIKNYGNSDISYIKDSMQESLSLKPLP